VSRLWGWLAFAITLLGSALLYMTGQRNKARETAKRARVAVQASEANRQADHAARKAQEAARAQSKEVQSEADERDSGTRPSGTLRR
jgi:hypothetical protein